MQNEKLSQDMICAIVCFAGAVIFFVGVAFFNPIMPLMGIWLGVSLVFFGCYFVFYHFMIKKINALLDANPQP